MNAQQLFEQLGFEKNTSEYCNDKFIIYEKAIMNGTDIATIKFKDGYFVYTTAFCSPMRTYGKLLQAIYKQMEELGWLNEDCEE